MRHIATLVALATAVVALPASAAEPTPSTATAEEAPASSAHPATADGAKAFVQACYQDIDTLVASGEATEPMRAKIIAAMQVFVDFQELSRLTIKAQWDELGEAKQKEFVDLFKQLIERSYARRFEPDSRLSVSYLGEPKLREGKAQVKTAIESGDVKAEVEYRLHRPEGAETWWVYDIVIDDVSFMRNYRSQFGKIIGKDGVDGLFAKLREKVETGEE